jgi:hypothetical protein
LSPVSVPEIVLASSQNPPPNRVAGAPVVADPNAAVFFANKDAGK